MFIGSNSRAGSRAFYWTDQTGMQDLGVLPGWATSAGEGINDMDEIAGTLQGFQGKSISHAVLWTQSGGRTRVKDLGALPGGFQAFATALNNVGQVVGASDTGQSEALDHAFVWSTATGMQETHAFLLTPTQ